MKKKLQSNVEQTDQWQSMLAALQHASRIIEAARAYCAVRDHPFPRQDASVEPYYYANLRDAVKKVFSQKSCASLVSEQRRGTVQA